MQNIVNLFKPTFWASWFGKYPVKGTIALLGLIIVARKMANGIHAVYRHFIRPARNLNERYGHCWVLITDVTDVVGAAYAMILGKNFNLLLLHDKDHPVDPEIIETVEKEEHKVVTMEIDYREGYGGESFKKVKDFIAENDIGIIINNQLNIAMEAELLKKERLEFADASIPFFHEGVVFPLLLIRNVIPSMLKREKKSAIIVVGHKPYLLFSYHEMSVNAFMKGYLKSLSSEYHEKIDAIRFECGSVIGLPKAEGAKRWLQVPAKLEVQAQINSIGYEKHGASHWKHSIEPIITSFKPLKAPPRKPGEYLEGDQDINEKSSRKKPEIVKDPEPIPDPIPPVKEEEIIEEKSSRPVRPEPEPEPEPPKPEPIVEPPKIEIPAPVVEPSPPVAEESPKKEEPTTPLSPEEEKTPKISEGDASPGFNLGSMLSSVVEKAALTEIKKVVESHQTEAVAENRAVTETGKVEWRKTHFIFIIDCSGSMKGSRWESVKTGYTDVLLRMKKMPEIVVSSFTFDDKVNPFCKERNPEFALKIAKNMPFGGKGTDYKRAMEYAISIMKKAKNQEYLPVFVFLSDGMGGYPTDEIKELKTMRGSGKKTLFYTIACETDEEEEMIQMSKELEGEHYKVLSVDAAKIVFANILGV